jgi:hypothetical protein
MLKIIKLSAMLILSGLSFVSCVSCSKKVAPQGSSSDPEPKQSVLPSAPCIIYKTKADYSRYVPVMLSEDKKNLVSYPDIRDVYYKGKLAYPTLLTDGFLLDNRGIGPNAAFLNFTYEAYSGLSKTPTADELMKSILDPDPITEMYNCGYRSKYADPEKELNALITSGKLKDFKKLK